MLEEGKIKSYYGYIIVVAAFCIMVVMWGTFYTFGVFFKPLSTDFGWTRAVTSGAFSVYMILHGLFAIGAGRLNDKLGPRLVMGICGFFLGFGYWLMSQISAVWHLYLFYGIVIAIGMSGSFVPILSTVARWFTSRRSTMTGVAVAGIGVGTMTMSPLTSWLISTYDWRVSYSVVSIISGVSIIVAAQFLVREPACLGLTPYAKDNISKPVQDAEPISSSLVSAFLTKQFWLFCAMYFCVLFCVNPVMVHIVPHTTDLGISAGIAATFLTTIGAVSIPSKVFIGSVADSIGIKPAFVICFIFMAIGYLLLVFAREVWMFYLFAAIFGFAYGGTSTLMSPMAAELFGLRAHGELLGVALFIATFGGATGSTFAGYIFDITGTYALAFVACIIISITAIPLTLFLRHPQITD